MGKAKWETAKWTVTHVVTLPINIAVVKRALAKDVEGICLEEYVLWVTACTGWAGTRSVMGRQLFTWLWRRPDRVGTDQALFCYWCFIVTKWPWFYTVYLSNLTSSCSYFYKNNLYDRMPFLLLICHQETTCRLATYPLHIVLCVIRTCQAYLQTMMSSIQCESKKIPPWGLVAIFPKGLGIFQPNFTCLLCVPIYARVQTFIQLSATLTKLCHIKHDHHNVQCSKFPPSTTTHAGWSHLIWHNFVTVGDKWTKICILACVWMFNRHVKFRLKIPNCLGKMSGNAFQPIVDVLRTWF